MSAVTREDWPPYWEEKNIPQAFQREYDAELKRIADKPMESWRDTTEYFTALAQADLRYAQQVRDWWTPQKKAMEEKERCAGLLKAQKPVADSHWLQDRL